MFYYLSGKVAHLEPNLAVIDCGGVGYACRTTNYTLGKLAIDKPSKLFTYVNVREDAIEIYGFASTEELNCFKNLLGVSGVGPKAALSMLSSVTPAALAAAVVAEDVKTLTAAPGVGKKMAQRIILELKDKLAKTMPVVDTASPASNLVIPENKLNEASAALAVLGYSSQEIRAALQGIDLQNLPLEEVIRQALRSTLK